MDERIRFVFEANLGIWTITELCQSYGISRKTGYKWLKRYASGGLEAMYELSRAPKHCPHRTSSQVIDALVAQKRRHPSWGPKKIARVVANQGVEFKIPAPSTIGRILDSKGLVKRRRRRRTLVKRWPAQLTKPQQPNHVWGVDFKGWFRTRDGNRCDPLTASDLYSRFVLGCQALEAQKTHMVRPVFEQVFKQYGLPAIIRVDNGSPFASQGSLGLTRLSMWWVQLGIRVEFIEPGHPEQNGIHERMHRTLKQDATCPPEANLSQQQRRFNRWQREFNFDRPHESLAMRCPADVYEPSERRYPKKLKAFTYPAWFEKRRVRGSGQISFECKPRFIGLAFAGINVGLEAISAEHYLVHAGPLVLGVLARNSKQPMELTVDLPQLEN